MFGQILFQFTGTLLPKRMENEYDPGDSPAPRGWLAGAALNNNRFAIFGGLAGDDEKPVRLGDLWIGELEEADE